LSPSVSSQRAALLYGLATLAGLTALTALLAGLLADAPAGDLVLMSIFLALTGGASLALGLLFLRAYRGRFLRGVRGKLLLAVVMSALLVLVNVGFTAYLMFISSHDLTLLVLLMGFSLGMAAYFALVVADSFDSTLQTLLQGVRQMGEARLDTRIDVRSGDEMEDLGRAFNAMAAKLEDAFAHQRDMEQARRQLVAAVSHDLRTPLATMQVMVESISEGVVTDGETLQRYHRTLLSEISYLSRLIDDLFELSQLDFGLLKLQPESASISDLVSDTLEALRPQAEQRRLTLQGEVKGYIPDVLMDTPRMQRVLYNLVQNALRHTPPDGAVLIRAADHGEEVEVSVADTGEGIDAEELTRVFERFYRGNRARSRDDAGSGLGLTIAKGIVELHGGRIWAESSRGAGSTFVFTLPKSRELVEAS
jgi:two-component system sensor histidine kinase SaeS